VLALAEHFPHIRVIQCLECRDLQFKKVVLRGVKVNSVDALGNFEGEGEDVVPGAGETEDHVVRLDLEDAGVLTAVFPSERIDVFVVELSVLLELFVVVDPPVMVLVLERGKRKVSGQIDDRGFVCLRAAPERIGAFEACFCLEE
jgi:hypothetical protein